MAVTPTAELGQTIKQLGKDINITNQNLSPDETDNVMILTPLDTFELTLTVNVYRRNYETNTLVFDHPTYGDLDVFIWDGGYAGDGALFPMTFTFPFDEVQGKILLDTYTS